MSNVNEAYSKPTIYREAATSCGLIPTKDNVILAVHSRVSGIALNGTSQNGTTTYAMTVVGYGAESYGIELGDWVIISDESYAKPISVGKNEYSQSRAKAFAEHNTKIGIKLAANEGYYVVDYISVPAFAIIAKLAPEAISNMKENITFTREHRCVTIGKAKSNILLS